MLLGQYDYEVMRILRIRQKTKKQIQKLLLQQSDKFCHRAAGQFDKLMLQEKNREAAVLLALLAEFLNNSVD